jgi:uncharacterized protein (UPF0332 family)
MTLTSEEKSDLIKYRLNQAQDSVEVAALLAEKGKYPAAVNRMYYAVFYCLLALALKCEFETSKHLQLIGWFNKNFVATGKIETKYGVILRKCYEYRKAADYDAFVVFEKENVDDLLSNTIKFIKRINQFLEMK